MTEKPLLVIISADYPDEKYVYGDSFVHTRVLAYRDYFNIQVIGYNTTLEYKREYEYDGISVGIFNDLNEFYGRFNEVKPDLVAGHLIQYHYFDFLLTLPCPLLVFFHGYDSTSWKRRLMNYDSLGALKYLWPYVKSNTKQLNGLRKLIKASNELGNIQFVFVSKWLKGASELDIKAKFDHSHIIPNGIDTDLFAFQQKTPAHRNKILIIRSFKANNYANDLSIAAIRLLSKKSAFEDVRISIYGEGFLFKPLTDQIANLPNVSLHNIFVENKLIPQIHQDFGIFLCPSRLDSQGVSMCEAMSSGLVPIASPVGGIPEFVVDGVSGYLASSPEEIAEKIEYLLEHPDVFVNMSRQARLAVLNKCSLRQVILKETKLMNSMLHRARESNSKNTQCTKCILGSDDDPDITFDNDGVCSYCQEYGKQLATRTGHPDKLNLDKEITAIKSAGKGKTYDCIIGLSGGLDSTYLALQAKELGLRPLAIHFDNGWDSELAVMNIEKIVTKLGIDLVTFVVDWEEFRDLQLAFLKASVVDIEMITDHAILAVIYREAIKRKIRYILSGANTATESILPPSWIHDKRDHVHIRAINKRFGNIPLSNFPLLTSNLKFMVRWHNIHTVDLLNLLPFDKKSAKSIVTEKLGWRDYGGKHYESIFTRFYQGYILPKKFGIDKRKAHLSNLICSGQISRQEALEEMEKPAYEESLIKSDYQYVLKKLGISVDEFESIMDQPVRRHSDYPVDTGIYSRLPFLKIFRPAWRRIKQLRRIQ